MRRTASFADADAGVWTSTITLHLRSTAIPRQPAAARQRPERARLELGSQVIKTAARTGRRPPVKLGLHPRYPRPRPLWDVLAGAAIRRRILRHCSLLPSSKPLPPFPMCRAFPGSEYYGGSAPSRAAQPTAGPARPPRWERGDGQARDGSRVHCDSIAEGGARLCPSGLAASTPQAFPAASRSPASRLPEVPRHSLPQASAHRSRPRSARFEPV